MAQLQKTKILLEVSGVMHPVTLEVWHDLPPIRGLSLEDAVITWSSRTKVYTADSLAEYITEKCSGYTCLTEKQYEDKLRPNTQR